MRRSTPITTKVFRPTAGSSSFTLLSFLFFLILAGVTFARQSWTYSSDTGPYSDLKGSTPLKLAPGGSHADTVFTVDLKGETFNLYGEQYRCDESTPLVIYGGGFIRFDNSNNAVVIDGYLSFLEEFDGESQVSYKVEQMEEEKILKVEWKRMAVIDSPEVAQDYVNFQVWVYQKSGLVELRYGSNTVVPQPGQLPGGGAYIGIFQFLELPIFQILEKNWLIGDAAAPEYDSTTSAFYLIEGVPPQGTIFRFTPKVSSGVGSDKSDGMGEFRVFPNPTTGSVKVESSGPVRHDTEVRMIDVLGRTVHETTMHAFSSALDIDLPGPGVYYCEILKEDGAHVFSVVCR